MDDDIVENKEYFFIRIFNVEGAILSNSGEDYGTYQLFIYDNDKEDDKPETHDTTVVSTIIDNSGKKDTIGYEDVAFAITKFPAYKYVRFETTEVDGEVTKIIVAEEILKDYKVVIVDLPKGILTYNGKAVKVPFPVKLECSMLQDLGMISYNDDNDFAIKNPWKSWNLTFRTSKGAWGILDEDLGLFLFFDNNGVVWLLDSVPGDNGDPVSVSGSAQVLPITWEGRDPDNCLIANVNVFVAPMKNLSNGFFKKYKVELVFNEMTLVGAHNITEN